MPFTPEKKRDYDTKRYIAKKANEPAEAKKVYFPMRYAEAMIAAAGRIASEGQLTGKYPWKSIPDVMRAMLAIGFRTFRDESGDLHVASLLEKLEAESQLSDMSRERRSAFTILAKAKVEVQALLDIKATTEAVQLYSTLYDNIDKMSRTTWTEWLSRQLQAAFPDLHAKHTRGHVPGLSLRRRRSGEERRDDKDRRGKRK